MCVCVCGCVCVGGHCRTRWLSFVCHVTLTQRSGSTRLFTRTPPLAVAHHILHCLAFGNSLSAPESISDARFLSLVAHHLQSSYLWSHILPVPSRRDITLLLPDLASFDPAWATEACSAIFGLPHVNLDVLVALQREWPVGVFLREIHPQIANLVRFWDRHLPLTEVQNTCVLCRGPIIRYTPVLGPHAPTSPLFCCRSLVHSACLNINFTLAVRRASVTNKFPVSSATLRR